MHLRYDGLAEPLVLPAGHSGEDFHALLPSLVTDLSRRAATSTSSAR